MRILRPKASRPLQAIDLFAGSGAVSLGLKQAGFKVVGALDFDPKACEIYRLNHPEVNLIEKDIRKVPASTFKAFKGEIDVLVVCAPCQPFSNRNRNRISRDDRTDLVLQSIKFIKLLTPTFLVFENVPGLERSAVFTELRHRLKAQKYTFLNADKVDAADLGVAQRRVRMVLCATKEPELLEEIRNLPDPNSATVRMVIGDLDSPPFKSDNLSDTLHYRRRHSALNLERLRHIPKNGGSRISMPEHLVLECHKNLKDKKYPDCYGRMAWDSEAPTLTTGCTDFTRGRYIHPEEDRAITLREAARIQSFPDDYLFAGNASEIAIQIGNAVPPLMMQSLAEQIKSAIQDVAS